MVVYLTNQAFVCIYEDATLKRIFRRMEEWIGGYTPDEYAVVPVTVDNLSVLLTIDVYGTTYSMRIDRYADDSGYRVAVYSTQKAAATLLTHARRLVETLA